MHENARYKCAKVQLQVASLQLIFVQFGCFFPGDFANIILSEELIITMLLRERLLEN